MSSLNFFDTIPTYGLVSSYVHDVQLHIYGTRTRSRRNDGRAENKIPAVVSDEKDYLNSKVFTKNKSNLNKLNEAREKIARKKQKGLKLVCELIT